MSTKQQHKRVAVKTKLKKKAAKPSAARQSALKSSAAKSSALKSSAPKSSAAKQRPAVEPTKEILLAGSGGQGVILTGKMLAKAAVAEGWNATYIPAYGAEVRGGAAYCHVKIGRRQIGSPIVEDASLIVAMNEPSYRAFTSLLRKGSTLLVNSSLVPTIGKHPGVKVVTLELTKIAADLGSLRSANMLVLGVCAGLLGLKDREYLKGLLANVLGKKNPAMLETNEHILEKGMELGQAAVDE